jgi:hypothetical protein
MVFGFSGVAAAAPEKPDDTTATSCTARPITGEEVSAEYIRTLDGRDFAAYKAVEFGFGLALSEGHCAGDSITFTPPQELGSNGSPVDLTTDGGEVIAHAVYADGKVSVTLTDAVEDPSKHSFEGFAYWRVSMKDTLVPGETRDLIWEIDGQIRRTQIYVAQCPGCEQPGPGTSKWGGVPSGNPPPDTMAGGFSPPEHPLPSHSDGGFTHRHPGQPRVPGPGCADISRSGVCLPCASGASRCVQHGRCLGSAPVHPPYSRYGSGVHLHYRNHQGSAQHRRKGSF